MKHFAAADASDRIVGVQTVYDTVAPDGTPIPATDPYTPEKLAESTPVGVRSVETPALARPRKDKLDADDLVIPDPDTETADVVTKDERFFNEAQLKSAFLAMMDVVNVRLLSAGLPVITGAELLAAYKTRRGH